MQVCFVISFAKTSGLVVYLWPLTVYELKFRFFAFLCVQWILTCNVQMNCGANEGCLREAHPSCICVDRPVLHCGLFLMYFHKDLLIHIIFAQFWLFHVFSEIADVYCFSSVVVNGNISNNLHFSMPHYGALTVNSKHAVSFKFFKRCAVDKMFETFDNLLHVVIFSVHMFVCI